MNNEVMDYTKFDGIIARLNLNDYYLTILNWYERNELSGNRQDSQPTDKYGVGCFE